MNVHVRWQLVLLVAALFWLVFGYGYIEDDAFIHLEFARGVAEGRGFSFNGQRINGDTSPLWVMLLVAAHAIGLSWIGAAKFLCGLGVLIALAGAYRVARDISAGVPGSIQVPLAAILVTASNPYFVHWSFSGMESVTALGLSFWAIVTVFSPRPLGWSRLTLGAMLLAVAPLLRPELLLLSALAGSFLLFRAWRLPAETSHRFFGISALVVIMALPTVAWSTYAISTFGYIMPNTNAAKRGGSMVSVATNLASVYAVGFAATFALIPFVARRLMRPQVPAAVWALLAWPAACAAFYLADHTAVQTRYCLLSMPSVTIAVLWLLGSYPRTRSVRSIVAGMCLFNLSIVIAIVTPHVANKVRLVQSVSTASAYIRNNLPANAPIAVFSIGQFAFESRHPLIDIGGITRPGVLPYLNDLPATIRWAKSQGAEYYIGGDPGEADAERVFSYSEPFLGWSFRRSQYDTETTTGIYRFASGASASP